MFIRKMNPRRLFVKAISDRFELVEITGIDKIMRACGSLQKIFLWPRAHSEVVAQLENKPPPRSRRGGGSNNYDTAHYQSGNTAKITQLKLPLDDSMKKLQKTLLNLAEDILHAIASQNSDCKKALEAEGGISELVSTSVFRHFSTILRNKLELFLRNNRLPRIQNMVQDVGNFHLLFDRLLRLDCVEFYRYLHAFRKAQHERPEWLGSEHADALFLLAKKRLLDKNELILKPPPKWEAVLKILHRFCGYSSEASYEEEAPINVQLENYCKATFSTKTATSSSTSSSFPNQIDNSSLPPLRPLGKEDTTKNNAESQDGPAVRAKRPAVREPRCLIVCSEEREAWQFDTVLKHGVTHTLLRSFLSLLSSTATNNNNGSNKSSTSSTNSSFNSGNNNTNRYDMFLSFGTVNGAQKSDAARLMQHKQAAVELLETQKAKCAVELRKDRNGQLTQPRVVVCLAEQIEVFLDELRPELIVITEPDLFAIRCVEIYSCTFSATDQQQHHLAAISHLSGSTTSPVNKNQLEVHLLALNESVELYKYETNLKREAQSVDSVARMKKFFVRDISVFHNSKLVLYDDPAERKLEEDTRVGGRAKQVVKKQTTIVADLREFNARLPLYLSQNHKLLPAHLSIGDYILSRDLCIERKAIEDLIQSLDSGRLKVQAQHLSKAYATPTLLVEFLSSSRFLYWSSNSSSTNSNKIIGSFRELTPHRIQLLRQKLLVLLINIPHLRVIWSPSLAYTARLFDKLKKNRCEPVSDQNHLVKGVAENILGNDRPVNLFYR